MSNTFQQPEGNFYNKYETKNPISVFLMKKFFESIDKLLKNIPYTPKTIFETGCGEGHVISHIYYKLYNNKDVKCFASDISEKVIKQAQIDYPEINFMSKSIYDIEKNDYDLVIASEVLEHLEKPELALKKVIDISNKYIFVSVPNEPLWRILNMLRGSYLKSFGNTPGHIQHWSISSFKKFLLQENVKIIAHSTPIPWQMYLLEKK